MFIGVRWEPISDHYSCQYTLTDSEFGCITGIGIATSWGTAGVVIDEYDKRKLNVAANLVRLLAFHRANVGWSFETQIDWWTTLQPLFTPELKADLNKYLLLV